MPPGEQRPLPEPLEACVVPLVPEAIAQLARSWMAGVDGVFVAPDVPHRKDHNARGVHKDALAPDEPLVVLFDDTQCGAGR